jgi:signal peptidase I
VAGLRDYVYIALAVGAVFGALALYAGNWPPVLTVESNSMMHVNESELRGAKGDTRPEDMPFGRPGTLDPGDLFIVKSVDDPREDITTYAEASESSYGDRGDVIVYDRTGKGRDLTVVHRAMTYVNVSGNGSDRTYTVQWTDEWLVPPEDISTCERGPEYKCTFDNRGVFLPELGIYDCEGSSGIRGGTCEQRVPKPFLGSGFITKGDNVVTNDGADQGYVARGDPLNPQPVVDRQIQGTAKGEIPAIGLYRLAISGEVVRNYRAQDHPHFLRFGNMVAPLDLWAVAIVEGVAIMAAPAMGSAGLHYYRGREEERVGELAALRKAASRKRGG